MDNESSVTASSCAQAQCADCEMGCHLVSFDGLAGLAAYENGSAVDLPSTKPLPSVVIVPH